MDMSAFGRQKKRTYLILLNDCLVALDLAESIGVYDPAAEVIVEQSMAGALRAVEEAPHIVAAFVSADPVKFSASCLADMIRSRSGQVFLMGSEAEENGETLGWKVLHRPFSEGLVLAHLASLDSA